MVKFFRKNRSGKIRGKKGPSGLNTNTLGTQGYLGIPGQEQGDKGNIGDPGPICICRFDGDDIEDVGVTGATGLDYLEYQTDQFKNVPQSIESVSLLNIDFVEIPEYNNSIEAFFSLGSRRLFNLGDEIVRITPKNVNTILLDNFTSPNGAIGYNGVDTRVPEVNVSGEFWYASSVLGSNFNGSSPRIISGGRLEYSRATVSGVFTAFIPFVPVNGKLYEIRSRLSSHAHISTGNGGFGLTGDKVNVSFFSSSNDAGPWFRYSNSNTTVTLFSRPAYNGSDVNHGTVSVSNQVNYIVYTIRLDMRSMPSYYMVEWYQDEVKIRSEVISGSGININYIGGYSTGFMTILKDYLSVYEITP